MAAPRLVVELAIEEVDVTRLIAIARSRTEPASRVERAVAFGPLAALDDSPRPGKEATLIGLAPESGEFSWDEELDDEAETIYERV